MVKYIEIPDGSPAFHLACEEVIFEREQEGDILLLWSASEYLSGNECLPRTQARH